MNAHSHGKKIVQGSLIRQRLNLSRRLFLELKVKFMQTTKETIQISIVYLQISRASLRLSGKLTIDYKERKRFYPNKKSW